MASILLFEDFYATIEDVEWAIAGTEHRIVAEAQTLDRAQHFLSKIVARELQADVLLLDGTLGGHNRPTEFRHTFPLDGTEVARKSIFGRPKPPKPREIVVQNLEEGVGGDARMVKKILSACDIQIPIIGISGDSMEYNGVEVDVDLGKADLRRRLLPALELLLSEQQAS